MLISLAVLAIGLSGVAAAVYVGIGQTQNSLDDSAAAAVARQAAATLSQIMTQANTGEWGDGKFHSFPESTTPVPGMLQSAVAGSQICTGDPRYAWVPLYRRDTGSGVAQLLILVLRADARPAFDARDLQTVDPLYPATLLPARAEAYSVEVRGNEIGLKMPGGPERLSPGTLVVLCDGNSPMNGRVVRLSGPGDAGRWTLTPGQDLADAIQAHIREAAADPGVDRDFRYDLEGAYVIGRGYADPARPADGFAGTSQAIAAYSTIVTLR